MQGIEVDRELATYVTCCFNKFDSKERDKEEYDPGFHSFQKRRAFIIEYRLWHNEIRHREEAYRWWKWRWGRLDGCSVGNG